MLNTPGRLHMGSLHPTFPSLSYQVNAAAASAKSLQSCPTLCNPRDSSPPGSSVPGILQATTLEWVAISRLMGWPNTSINFCISQFLLKELIWLMLPFKLKAQSIQPPPSSIVFALYICYTYTCVCVCVCVCVCDWHVPFPPLSHQHLLD